MHQLLYRPVNPKDYGVATGTPTVIQTPDGQRAVRVCATVDVRVSFAPDTAGIGVLLPANLPEYYSTHPGDKLQVEAATATGTVNVAYLTR